MLANLCWTRSKEYRVERIVMMQGSQHRPGCIYVYVQFKKFRLRSRRRYCERLAISAQTVLSTLTSTSLLIHIKLDILNGTNGDANLCWSGSLPAEALFSGIHKSCCCGGGDGGNHKIRRAISAAHNLSQTHTLISTRLKRSDSIRPDYATYKFHTRQIRKRSRWFDRPNDLNSHEQSSNNRDDRKVPSQQEWRLPNRNHERSAPSSPLPSFSMAWPNPANSTGSKSRSRQRKKTHHCQSAIFSGPFCLFHYLHRKHGDHLLNLLHPQLWQCLERSTAKVLRIRNQRPKGPGCLRFQVWRLGR